MNYAFLSGISMVMIVFSFGVKMYRNPSGMNSYLAYRTDFSRKTEDTWYAANIFAGLLLMVLAVFLMLLLIFVEGILRDQSKIMMIIAGYFIAGGLIIYVLTERRLRKTFHRDGKRRAGSF